MRTIVIGNKKGGVGKTTTAYCLATELNHRGYRVLAIDYDGQCNLTKVAGVNQDGPTSYGVLTKEVYIGQAIIHLDWLDLIQASPSLNVADTALPQQLGSYLLTAEALKQIADDYDFCIIDTPPAVGIVTVNAIIAADYIVIPAEANELSSDGIARVFESVLDVQKNYNNNLKIAGILLTRYEQNTVLARQYLSYFETLAKGMGTKVFNTKIRKTVNLSEIASLHTPIFTYRPDSKGNKDYISFTDELLQTMGVKKNG